MEHHFRYGLLRTLDANDLRAYKVAIRRHGITCSEPSGPLIRDLGDPAALVVHVRKDDFLDRFRPLFSKKDVQVNVVELDGEPGVDRRLDKRCVLNENDSNEPPKKPSSPKRVHRRTRSRSPLPYNRRRRSPRRSPSPKPTSRRVRSSSRSPGAASRSRRTYRSTSRSPLKPGEYRPSRDREYFKQREEEHTVESSRRHKSLDRRSRSPRSSRHRSRSPTRSTHYSRRRSPSSRAETSRRSRSRTRSYNRRKSLSKSPQYKRRRTKSRSPQRSSSHAYSHGHGPYPEYYYPELPPEYYVPIMHPPAFYPPEFRGMYPRPTGPLLMPRIPVGMINSRYRSRMPVYNHRNIPPLGSTRTSCEVGSSEEIINVTTAVTTSSTTNVMVAKAATAIPSTSTNVSEVMNPDSHIKGDTTEYLKATEEANAETT